eukprot:Gb_32741 [translate_table: standard]
MRVEDLLLILKYKSTTTLPLHIIGLRIGWTPGYNISFRAMAMAMQQKRIPHALLFPFPLQGHTKPMMQLANILSSRGFYITFVTTEFLHERLIASGCIPNPNAVSQLENFRFETVPDGLPPEHPGRTYNVPDICKSMKDNGSVYFRDLVNKIAHLPHVPPLSFIISDGILSYTQDIANQFGVPRIAFWTNGAYGFSAYFHIPLLIEKGIVPIKDDESYLSNGYMDKVITCIPGMASLRIRDLPSFCFVNDASDYMLNFAMTEAQSCRQASALILNTFDESEQPIMEALSNELSVYSIGPLLLSESDGEVKTRNLLLGSSLWKEETGCLQWLDTQQPGSVIYVCFGSITMLSSKQVAEFAWGLESSKQPFLWAIRPDLVHGESAILPNEFIEETRSRGMFVSWAPQIKVLSHPSVGGFLTH